MSRFVVDIFSHCPWLVPIERWHPKAPELVEEARGLTWLVPDDASHGLEIWATLGEMTQADVLRRVRSTSSLRELWRFEESVPGWPVIARCLVQLAGSELPGRYFAAVNLLDLMSEARERGFHRELLPTEWLELKLGLWNDDVRHIYRSAIRTRAMQSTRSHSPLELWFDDEYWDLAEASERALSDASLPRDDFLCRFLDRGWAGR